LSDMACVNATEEEKGAEKGKEVENGEEWRVRAVRGLCVCSV